MHIEIRELRRFAELLFDHIEHEHGNSVEIRDDYYWNVPEDQKYDVLHDPKDLNIGQLTEDYKNLNDIGVGVQPPIGYALVWLASLLQRTGERWVS